MGKVILKSVQDIKCLESILNGEYKPSFSKSCGAFDSECTKSYKYMLNKLSDKTGVEYIEGEDTCIWSWYQNPYFRNHVNFRNHGVDLVVITFWVNEEDVVLSDFDLWCDMLLDGKGTEPLVSIDDIDIHDCIQAVTWRIPRENILCIESFKKYIKTDLGSAV